MVNFHVQRPSYFVKSKLNAYSLNSVTTRKNDDGSTAIHLVGCEDSRINCLPMVGTGLYHQLRM